jgi:crotonobetainyl-CoA:carnitine CoA-transferase CaiB-like acyl-CoA transferase
LDAVLAAWTAQFDANSLAEMLQNAGVAAHASWTTPELATDPHLRLRGAIADVAEPDGTMRAAVGVPMRMAKHPDIGISRGTPLLGQDEDAIYGELLGMGADERRALVDQEVIF